MTGPAGADRSRRRGCRSPWRRRRARIRAGRSSAPGAARRAAGLLRAARAHGYVTGAHCLGGAYAVAPALLRHADLFDPEPWLGVGLGEDVVLGVLCHAAGLEPRGLVGPGEPFGLAHVGLPAPPDELIAAGHSIVHAVKHRDAATEEQLREVFRLARAT